MDYQECKFYIKYGRCSHKAAPAPEPYHSQCLGKEECIVWNDPIQNRALDADSPIQNAAQEMYEALKALMQGQEVEDNIPDVPIRVVVRACPSEEAILAGFKALARVNGK